MPTLDDWYAKCRDEEEREIVDTFYGLRPDWLAFGDVSREILVRLESEVAGVPVLEVELDECSIYWARWHNHYWGWPHAIALAIRHVEGILNETLVAVVNYYAEGDWAGSNLCSPDDVRWEDRSPGPRRPVKRVITSWKNTFTREESIGA